MTRFVMRPKIGANPRPDIHETALALDSNTIGEWRSNTDLGKALKLGGNSTYHLCKEGDEIEGFLVAMDPITVNEGYKFGTVQRNQRKQCVNTGSAALKIGDFVVAGDQTKPGTAPGFPITGNDRYLMSVKKFEAATPEAKAAGALPINKWRVISFEGPDGSTDSILTIERI